MWRNPPSLVIILLVVGVWVAVGVAGAGTFEGLEPGRSTKADADAILGVPIREVMAGVRYDYDPTKYQARRISIQVDPASGVIQKIDLHLATSYQKADYQEWFGLTGATSARPDDNGNLVETYLPEGISLHFAGPDDSFSVAYFRHFDPRMASGSEGGRSVEAGLVPPEKGEEKPHLGVSFSTSDHEQGVRIRAVMPGSPADRAGIKVGDLVLELGPHTLYRAGIEEAEFIILLGQSPVDKPVRIIVERGSRRYELHAQFELRDPEVAAEERRRLAFEAFQEGESLARQGKCERALPLLDKAYVLNNRDLRTLELLGVCRFKERDYGAALRSFNSARRLAPNSPTLLYWTGTCHDALGNAEEAVNYYQQYLSANDGDKKQRKIARKRVRAITEQPDQNVDWNKAISDIAGAVRGEMDDFNKE